MVSPETLTRALSPVEITVTWTLLALSTKLGFGPVVHSGLSGNPVLGLLSKLQILGIEVDDALAIAEQVDVRISGAKPTGFAPFLIVVHVP